MARTIDADSQTVVRRGRGIDMALQAVEVRNPQASKEQRPGSSISKEIDRMRETIMKRAEEIFHQNGNLPGADLDNWLAAERELIWEPSIKLTENENAYTLAVAVPGVDPKDITIQVTPEEL